MLAKIIGINESFLIAVYFICCSVIGQEGPSKPNEATENSVPTSGASPALFPNGAFLKYPSRFIFTFLFINGYRKRSPKRWACFQCRR